MNEIAIRASVKPKINESIIINSQLSPSMLMTKSISEIVVKIRGEIR